jgi:hypothetical protein
MNLIFRNDIEVLRELTEDEITAEVLETLYADESIRRYELVFKEGVKVKECHDFDDITPDMLSEVIITIAH